jgi:hypothetical protein
VSELAASNYTERVFGPAPGGDRGGPMPPKPGWAFHGRSYRNQSYASGSEGNNDQGPDIYNADLRTSYLVDG